MKTAVLGDVAAFAPALWHIAVESQVKQFKTRLTAAGMR